jgi:hypothetical protein
MVIALAIAVLLAYARGLISVIRADAKPNCLSWTIWAVIDLVLLIASFKTACSGSTNILLVIYTVGAILLAIASRSNLSKLNKLEWTAIVITAFSIIGWATTGNASVGLGLIILAHLCGTVLTLRSVWQSPRSEDRVMWILFALGNIANLFAISWTQWQSYAFPVYETIACLCIWLLATGCRKN